MDNHESAHLSEEQLAQFQDGELSGREARHLDTCPECGTRLIDLQSSTAAYAEYLESIRTPALPPVPKRWRELEALIAAHEAPRPRRARPWWLIPAVAAALSVLFAVVVISRRHVREPSAEATELLTRSARVDLPSNRMISLRLHGKTLLRPAVLVTPGPPGSDAEMDHLRLVFASAHYSWREPLSARSFARWRSGLSDKRDSVSVIHSTGRKRAYRVQTDTGAGALRSASLTIREEDLRPTSGAFRFEREDPLEMDEAPAAAPAASEARPTAPKESIVETPASPADTLHVLAALNAIGADVGEPIDVSEDARHNAVVVRANGLSAERRRQVADALKLLPRVKLDLDATSSEPHPAASRAGTPEKYSAGIPAVLRQQFEDRLGGAIALQETTDRVLDASTLLVARAHALELLASKFPPQVESSFSSPDRDLLRTLQQRHISELRRLAGQIRAGVKPLIPAASQSAYSAPPPQVALAAQEVDDSLNLLLAGAYSQSSGAAMLHTLAGQLESLDRAIQSQQVDRR